jgi:hypothetical protein
MRKMTLIFGMVVGIFACNTSQAGFISFGCYFPDDPYGYVHQWDYDFANSRLTVTETLLSRPTSGGDQIRISGVTDADPTFTLIKTITNITEETWTGYDLELIGNTTFVDGTAGSTKFGSTSFSDDLKILHFYAPHPVLNGEIVTLQVDITIPTVGLFDITMAQHPLPEPASIVLLGIGVLLLRKRKYNRY